MTYQLYGFAPDPDAVEEFDDLEEASARCEELVHEDGYDRAEVWDDAGELVYRASRRPAVLLRAAPSEVAGPRPSRSRHAGATRPAAAAERARPIPVVRDDDPADRPRRAAGRSDDGRSAPPAHAPDERGEWLPAPEPQALAARALASLADSAIVSGRQASVSRPAARATPERPVPRPQPLRADRAVPAPTPTAWVVGDRTAAPDVWFGAGD